MAEITCTCGQSFAAHYMLGEPRTRCPYCGRDLPQDPASEPLLAQLVEPENPPPIIPVTIQQATTPSTVSELIRKKDEWQRETKKQTLSHSWRIAPEEIPETPPPNIPSSPPAFPAERRFLDPAETTEAVGDVRQLLKQELARRTKTACQGCELATCEMAFSCGALPRGGHGLRYVLGWTLGVALLALLPTLIFVLPIWFVRTIDGEPHYGALAGWLAGIPLAIGTAVFLYTFFASRWRRAHWRSLAAAAKDLELQFCHLKTPSPASSAAFPVLCPGAGAASRPIAHDELNVEIVLAGKCEEHEVFVARHEFRFSVADHMPGRLFKEPPLLVPSLVLAQQWHRPLWRGYLLAMFPEPLADVPDYAIGSARNPEGSFLQRNYRGQFATVPSASGHPSVVFATAEAAAPPLPYALHELLGTLSPGWSLQVSAGRLIVWREAYWPKAPWTWPRSSAAIVELVQVASRVRRILADASGVDE